VATGIDAAQMAENKPQAAPAIETNRFYGGKVGFGPRAEQPKPVIASAPVPLPSKPAELPKEAQKRPAPVAETKPAAPSFKEAPRPTFLRSAAPAPQPVVQEPPVHSAEAEEELELVFGKNMQTTVGAATQSQDEVPVRIAVGDRSPSFISPQASQPAQRSFFSQPGELSPAKAPSGKISPREQASSYSAQQPRETPAGGGNAMNFFQRMAGVGRVLASRPDQSEARTLHVVEKPKADVVEHTSKSAEDDYLEIPAFLRRQAN
jgi:hypothetical protein